MTQELNYHIPLVNKVAAVVDPTDGYLRCTLPPYKTPRLLLNAIPVVAVINGQDTEATLYRDNALVNPYMFTSDGWELYLDSVTASQLIMNETMNPFAGNAWRFKVPYFIPANGTLISRFTNWDNAMLGRCGMAYAVVRG